MVNKAYLIGFLLLAAACCAQSTGQKEREDDLHFDLTKIGSVFDGRQICEDKYRLQDYPSKVMDQIIAAGPKSVPVLIGMLTDERMARTEEPIICFWGQMAIGDIAFCALEDLFLKGNSNKTTIPGASWNEMLGPSGDLLPFEQLHRFIAKEGRNALQAKWQGLWNRYGSQMFWDSKERCFRLKDQ
jgi:hypothetical protein